MTAKDILMITVDEYRKTKTIIAIGRSQPGRQSASSASAAATPPSPPLVPLAVPLRSYTSSAPAAFQGTQGWLLVVF